MQVGIGRSQINVGQRQTTGRLLHVDPFSHPRFGALPELIVSGLMLNVVFFSKKHMVAIANDIHIRSPRFQGCVFRCVKQFKITHQLGFAEPLDLAVSGKAIKNHLPQIHRCFIATVRQIRIDVSLLALFAHRPGQQIHSRQEAAPCHPNFFARLAERVPARLNLRILENGDLSSLFQRKMLRHLRACPRRLRLSRCH